MANVSSDAYEVYALKRGWSGSEVTWNQPTNTSPWDAAGADGFNDRSTTVLASITAPTLGWRDLPLDGAGIAQVQSWIDAPSSNHGFIILDYANSNGLDIRSSETALANERPMLTITFTGTRSGGSWAELVRDDFESGWGNWVSGGSDARLSPVHAIGGQCLEVRDNSGDASSAWVANTLNLAGYSKLKIAFTVMPSSFERSENFLLEYSADGGSTWTTVRDFVNNVDFVNLERQSIEETVDGGSYIFKSNARIRFRADASGNGDNAYIDNVVISAQ